jgi:hypothetical protein
LFGLTVKTVDNGRPSLQEKQKKIKNDPQTIESNFDQPMVTTYPGE